VMRSGDAVPAVGPDVRLTTAVMPMPFWLISSSAVVDPEHRPIGVFTDGDLRRLIERGQDFTVLTIRDVMHANPRRVHPEQLAVDAVAIMEEFRINQMLVVDADDKLVGALHIHDLTRAKVI
jgi:arabinose-5-phosphate isomerase